MVRTASFTTEPSTLARLHELQPRLPQLGRRELAETLSPLLESFHHGLPPGEVAEAAETALAFCRALYASARSADALALARAVLAQAELAADHALMRKAATACGVLSADSGDIAGAVEHHVRLLRLAAGSDPQEAVTAWNNIGLAVAIAGNYEMSARCYQRALAPVEAAAGPLYLRYAVCSNIANAYYQMGAVEDGLRFAYRALAEEAPAFLEHDEHGALLLRRNVVRLLIAGGEVQEAEPYVLEASALADRTRTPRSTIAAATTRALYELATGRTDVALTRLEQALTRARQLPATLRDTLVCVIRAEEAAGNAERALVRLNELSDHIYRTAIERARQHVELANLGVRDPMRVELETQQARARLVSKVAPPAQPESWPALERLAVSAVMRMDDSGWHGKRVGALTKMLAMAAGCDPLRALEMGLAAELHDIGMLSVPEAILRKQGPLNEAERAIVRRHADAGAEILGADRHPRILMAREMARYHHAHWDGSGHPERVGGKMIPVAARVCAVADAYDSMVCGLGSRQAKSMDDALAELRRCAGRQFDPDLVEAFDRMIRTQTEDLGLDLEKHSGLEGFQALVNALQEDRGFV